MSSEESTPARRTWPDYRAVWRWHFYAGLFCIPFVIVLSASGAIYLFKPQIEAWLERPYENLDVVGEPRAIAAQVRAAVESQPGSRVQSYELPTTPQSAGRVVVRKDGEAIRVWVHPETLAVLGAQPEDERLMRWMFKLHGELLMGDRGSNLVELAASWTIVMLLTGVYLWWPRSTSGGAGVLYPRLRRGASILWRDLHGVTGVWIVAFALFLLATGLPWAKFWGSYFKLARRLTGTAVAQQDWTTGSERGGGSGGSGEHAAHGGGSRGERAAGSGSRGDGGKQGGERATKPVDLAAFDRVAAVVRPLQLPHPVVLAPPGRGSADWSAKSMAQNRPLRVNLTIDAATGQIISRENYADRHWVDRVVGVGIAAHEGQLFGWPNQLLGLLTAVGLILLSVSGVILWWRRRDVGVLGAPRPLARPRLAAGLVVIVVLIGVYLPLFGASLLAVLIVERAMLRRIPRVSEWLGLG